MATADSGSLRCYFCSLQTDSINVLSQHCVKHHYSESRFSVRRAVLDEQSGVHVLKSVHFPLSVTELAKYTEDSKTCLFDINTGKISFRGLKRKQESSDSEKKKTSDDQIQQSLEHEGVGLHGELDTILDDCYLDEQTIFAGALRVINETGRGHDFVSVLKALADGTLNPRNIAVHLFLDIGKLLLTESISNVRYDDTTLDFWALVHRMFKGKATRFFRGPMSSNAHCNGKHTETKELKFNFAVPSEKTLIKHISKHKVDASKPGILAHSLAAFSQAHMSKDCKISMDGKKLTYGYGKQLGDENLCGHEQSPTLQERQAKFSKEKEMISAIETNLLDYSMDDLKLEEIHKEQALVIKDEIVDVMKMLSQNIRLLREMVTTKRRALHSLMQKVQGDWKTNPLAPSISFLKTKIIKANACIRALLDTIDRLGFAVATLNGVTHLYVSGFATTVTLQNQENHSCLKKFTEEVYQSIDPMKQPHLIKQHTEYWNSLRERAVVTGSTWFAALGLKTLKDQKQHYDKFFEGKSVPLTDDLRALFAHGTENEKNGVATLVGKYLPVFRPELMFQEDGCNVLTLCHDRYAVSSGDGTGVTDDGTPRIVFEVKCPKPGKVYASDVYYQLPLYYSIQVLAEMEGGHCEEYLNICYSPESSTFISGAKSDEWKDVERVTALLYPENPKKPTRVHPEVKDLKQKLQTFAKSSLFEVEFPSLRASPCGCDGENAHTDTSHPYIRHTGRERNDANLYIKHILETCQRAHEQHLEAYNLLRRPAKEVVVGVVSDLERSHTESGRQHAVPIAYYMAGFSLQMRSVRGMIREMVLQCRENGLKVKAFSSDGQFLEVYMKDDQGNPLSILALQKMTWMNARNQTKKDIVGFLFDLNKLPSIVDAQDLQDHFNIERSTDGSALVVSCKEKPTPVLTQPNIRKLLTPPSKKTCSQTLDEPEEDHSDIILQHLPDEILNSLDVDTLDLIRNVANRMVDKPEANDNNLPPVDTGGSNQDVVTDAPIEGILEALARGLSGEKFRSWTAEILKGNLASGGTISGSFTIPELKTILTTVRCPRKLSGMNKAGLVQLVSSTLGDGSEGPASTRRKTPQSLKNLVQRHISSWPVMALTAVYCNNIFLRELDNWNKMSYFKPMSSIILPNEQAYMIFQWYAQPTIIDNEPVQMILDPHHIFVNNRARVCRHGLTGMNISKQAWVDVATNSRENGTKLSLDLVTQVRDPQSNACAQTTFSNAVELELRKIGAVNEAEWCRLLREWYNAVDSAGLEPEERVQKLLEMRLFLLKRYNPFVYPPPGGFVNSLPIAQFEGILTNIDRRLQMYRLTQTGTYNHRSLSSLDSETFFSTFQDLDPKGTGVLRPDDIPTALSTACFINEQRLKDDRQFEMTTARSYVYKHNTFSADSSTADEDARALKDFEILVKKHPFDAKERKPLRPKRKPGTLTEANEVARGAAGVRSFHKINEEKLLAHQRCGYSEQDVDSIV